MMEFDEEFNTKERPKLELSMGPDGEVIFTEIPVERIAQERLDAEFNFDWSDGRTTDDCEQNPVTSTEINPEIFLVSVKHNTHKSIPSTEFNQKDIAKTEVYNQTSSLDNACNVKLTSDQLHGQETTASKHYEASPTCSTEDIIESYCEKNPILNEIFDKESSIVSTESNNIECTVNSKSYSEHSLIITGEGNSEESIASNLINSQGSEENIKAHIQECFEDGTKDKSIEPFTDNAKSYLQESPKSANNEDLLKEFIEFDAKANTIYQQESPKNANNEDLLKEFIELSNIEPFVIATGKNNTQTYNKDNFIAKSGNKSQKFIKASYAQNKTYYEATPITNKTYNEKTTLELSAKIYSMGYTSNSKTYTHKCTKMANIASLSQKSIEASTDAFGIGSVPDIGDYQLESPIKADDELLEDFIEASAKALLDPFMEESMEASSIEPFATPGKMFLEVPPSPSIESGSQDTFIAKSRNDSIKSVKASTKTYSKESFTATCKRICEEPHKPSVETYSQDTFIAKSENYSQKYIDASTKTLSKGLFTTIGKMFLEVPPSPSFETYSQERFVANSENYSQKSIDTSTKTNELFATTGNIFLEVPPSPIIESNSPKTFIAKSESYCQKSVETYKNKETFIAKSGNNHQKSIKASVKAYRKEPFIASYKTFLEELPSRPSTNVKLRVHNQVTFIAKSGKNCQKSRKASSKAFIKKPFIANCKTFLKEPPISSVETDSQETFLAKSENYSKYSPLKISEPYCKDSPMMSNDYGCQLSPVARTEDCSLGSPISINESFCPDSPRPIIEEPKLEWPNPPNLSKESQLEWPNLSMDDISVNCGDNLNGAKDTDLQKCAKCSADLTDSQQDLHLCDPDKVLNASYEDTLDDSLDEDNEEPCILRELTRKEKKKSKIDHRTISGKYKKRYRYRPRPDFKKPYPKPCNKDCKTCHICNKEFGRQRLLLVHMRRHTDSLNLQCEFCEKKFAASYDLERHVRMMHIARKRYSCYCSLCRIPFYSRTAAVDHQKRAHSHMAHRLVGNDDVEMTPIADKVEEIFDIICDVCGLKFCEQIDLDAHHMKSHSNVSDLDAGIKPHVVKKKFDIHCDVCGLKFNEKSDLDVHIEKSHSVEIFSCDVCGSKFNEKSDIDAHVKSHEKELIIQFYTPHKIDAETNVVLII